MGETANAHTPPDTPEAAAAASAIIQPEIFRLVVGQRHLRTLDTRPDHGSSGKEFWFLHFLTNYRYADRRSRTQSHSKFRRRKRRRQTHTHFCFCTNLCCCNRSSRSRNPCRKFFLPNKDEAKAEHPQREDGGDGFFSKLHSQDTIATSQSSPPEYPFRCGHKISPVSDRTEDRHRKKRTTGENVKTEIFPCCFHTSQPEALSRSSF